MMNFFGKTTSKILIFLATINIALLFPLESFANLIIAGRCHQGYCFEIDYRGKTLLKQKGDNVLYSIETANRSWRMDSSDNSKPSFSNEKLDYIYCSKTKPAYIFSSNGQYLAHLLNPGGEYFGYNYESTQLYWVTCHNMIGPNFFSEEMTGKAIQLGYPLNLEPEQIELANPLDIMH